MTTDQIKHLEFIQGAITRMNTNSFKLKGWMITIVTALLILPFALLFLDGWYYYIPRYFFCLLIIPVFLFWGLDAYYLQQERKFRGIYNTIIGLKTDIEIKPFEMPLHKFQGGEYSFCNVFFSKTIVLLYGSTAVLLLIISGFLFYSFFLQYNGA